MDLGRKNPAREEIDEQTEGNMEINNNTINKNDNNDLNSPSL